MQSSGIDIVYLLRETLEKWSNFKIQISIYSNEEDLVRCSPIPPLITDQILEKKVSLIPNRTILPNILNYTVMTYLKNLDETNSLNYLREFYLRYPHYLSQMSHPLMLLCCPQQVWTVSSSPEPLCENLGMGENSIQQPKIYSFPHQKNAP